MSLLVFSCGSQQLANNRKRSTMPIAATTEQVKKDSDQTKQDPVPQKEESKAAEKVAPPVSPKAEEPKKQIVNNEIGVVFEETSGSIALTAVSFEKNGEVKDFSVLNGTRKINPQFKVYSYYANGETKEIGQQPITDFSIGKEMRHVYGDGSWSFREWIPKSNNYIFTTMHTKGATANKGRATLLFDTNSETGKWIIGAKVKYRFFETENRGTLKITLVGPYSKKDVDHNQKGHAIDGKFEIGVLPAE